MRYGDNRPKPGEFGFEPRSFIEALENVYRLGGFNDTPETSPEKSAIARRGKRSFYNRMLGLR